MEYSGSELDIDIDFTSCKSRVDFKLWMGLIW
jgi:hypothetical protein